MLFVFGFPFLTLLAAIVAIKPLDAQKFEGGRYPNIHWWINQAFRHRISHRSQLGRPYQVGSLWSSEKVNEHDAVTLWHCDAKVVTRECLPFRMRTDCREWHALRLFFMRALCMRVRRLLASTGDQPWSLMTLCWKCLTWTLHSDSNFHKKSLPFVFLQGDNVALGCFRSWEEPFPSRKSSTFRCPHCWGLGRQYK